jgi:hypothetical protein
LILVGFGKTGLATNPIRGRKVTHFSFDFSVAAEIALSPLTLSLGIRSARRFLIHYKEKMIDPTP